MTGVVREPVSGEVERQCVRLVVDLQKGYAVYYTNLTVYKKRQHIKDIKHVLIYRYCIYVHTPNILYVHKVLSHIEVLF